MIDLSGRRFGMWLVEQETEPRSAPRQWRCRCDCGQVRDVRQGNLTQGKSKNCGCWRRSEKNRARLAAIATTHGHVTGGRASSEYTSWRAMLKRCYQPTVRSYELYGGRGITVCDEWLSFGIHCRHGPETDAEALTRSH